MPQEDAIAPFLYIPPVCKGCLLSVTILLLISPLMTSCLGVNSDQRGDATQSKNEVLFKGPGLFIYFRISCQGGREEERGLTL